MKRWCFLGNSHLAAIKLGVDAWADDLAAAGIEVDTFGSHGDTLRGIKIDDGVIRPRHDAMAERFEWTSGGKREIVLKDYDDIFLIFGESPHSIRLFMSDGDVPPMTHDLIRAVHDTWTRGWACQLSDRIAHAAPKARVHFLGEPFRSEECGEARKLLDGLGDDSAAAERIADIRRATDELLSQLGLAVASIVRQPAHLNEHRGLFTRAEYARGSVRLTDDLSVAHKTSDMRHMNGAFGERMVRHLIDSTA